MVANSTFDIGDAHDELNKKSMVPDQPTEENQNVILVVVFGSELVFELLFLTVNFYSSLLPHKIFQ